MAETLTAEPKFDLRRVQEVALVGLTSEASGALAGTRTLITRLPYRVGRESRRVLTKLAMSIERRLGTAPPLNDLYIEEKGQQVHVSREHFLIDASEEGFFLLDRGSACGTLVNGVLVGGSRKGGRVALDNGATIIAGSAASPFVFQFVYR